MKYQVAGIPIRSLRVGWLVLLNRFLPLGGRWYALLRHIWPASGLIEFRSLDYRILYPAAWLKTGITFVLQGVITYFADFWLIAARVTSLREGCLIDVGANAGVWPLLFRKYSRLPIVCYEPDPFLAQLAAYQVSHNHIEGVEIRRMACGDQLGKIMFNSGINGSIATGADLSEKKLRAAAGRMFDEDAVDIAARQTSEAAELVEVELTTLDHMHAQGKVAFIKIDCEGFEMNVLRGAHRIIVEQRPLLFVEIHPNFLPRMGTSALEVYEYLARYYAVSLHAVAKLDRRGLLRKVMAKYKSSRLVSLTFEEFRRVTEREERPDQIYAVCTSRDA